MTACGYSSRQRRIIMFRLRSVAAAAAFVAAILILLGIAAQWPVQQVADQGPLPETAGRLQLVLDEQDVGLVRQGTPLAVNFAVANTGTEKLCLRQAIDVDVDSGAMTTFVVEPGRTGEVVAELSADDLLARGRKHVRFLTSDPACPELWLTVRGTVIRTAAAVEPELE